MAYTIINYEYDEPAFKGTIRSALCDSQRDISKAYDDYASGKGCHYLVLTEDLSYEYDAWEKGYRNMINKRRVDALGNLLLGVSIIGIPLIYIKKYQWMKDLEAYSEINEGFFLCYLSNHYKYKDGKYGVNLAKESKEGYNFKRGIIY